ncbi:hypothetical protein H6P81_001167 [Aristolochia fimbriata]|uniref:Uncharacterized protein n=1 Tax=Aristolochia fimbriata TaxID=158543 RepID=A0AAV7F6T4_ARIFI|nr:hypothetical protein H6P81_001167 [Aristolochia fimbriata]
MGHSWLLDGNKLKRRTTTFNRVPERAVMNTAHCISLLSNSAVNWVKVVIIVRGEEADVPSSTIDRIILIQLFGLRFYRLKRNGQTGRGLQKNFFPVQGDQAQPLRYCKRDASFAPGSYLLLHVLYRRIAETR